MCQFCNLLKGLVTFNPENSLDNTVVLRVISILIISFLIDL